MLWAMVRLMRPNQWTKNLVLFAGLVFSRQALDPGLLVRSTAAFLLFCLLSASVYATNDVADLEKDRLHPKKRNRPVASGAVPKRLALGLGVTWGLAGVAGAYVLSPGFGFLAVLYLALNLAYTLGLKNAVVLDVLIISVGFVIRAIGGVEALKPVKPGIEISAWLLMCTLFLALFLALCKRRAELASLSDGAADHRKALANYSTGFLDQMIASVTAIILLAYSVYTIWPGTVAKFHTAGLLYTVPFVVYGLFRYLFLVYERQRGGNPAEVLLSDPPLGLAILGWMAAVGIVLY